MQQLLKSRLLIASALVVLTTLVVLAVLRPEDLSAAEVDTDRPAGLSFETVGVKGLRDPVPGRGGRWLVQRTKVGEGWLLVLTNYVARNPRDFDSDAKVIFVPDEAHQWDGK